MEYKDKFILWKTSTVFDPSVRQELSSLDMQKDEKEIEDRFYCDLQFGTGGLRGVMGAGTNRMNQYTVGRAAKGLGEYLLNRYGEDRCVLQGVAIGYDTRLNSRFFAEVTAGVLSSCGIRVFLFSEPAPTPQLSFAVRYKGCIAGVVITASHNPKEYNGFKVYDAYGCQLSPREASEVTACIDKITDYKDICFTKVKDLISCTDVTEPFVRAVSGQSRIKDGAVKKELHIIYTPLHGTGKVPVLRTLSENGFKNVEVVEEQAVFDGNFPTVESPNPEDPKALQRGIEQAKQNAADLVIGTDPDCDRIGVAVKTKTGFRQMTGNQTGAVLLDFLLTHTDPAQDVGRLAVVKTFVTSELGAEIARKKGLTVFTTPTGFKYIGEKVTQFEQRKDYEFFFGYEESCGYLAGVHARDKDAVIAALLVCEAAAYLKNQGKTLADRLEELYEEFGYYRDDLDSFVWKGRTGQERISSVMKRFRLENPPFENTRQVLDYSRPVPAEPGFGELPVCNVLKYILEDGSWVAVRPSGTEPKLKVYYSMRGADAQEAEQKLAGARAVIEKKLEV